MAVRISGMNSLGNHIIYVIFLVYDQDYLSEKLCTVNERVNFVDINACFVRNLRI